MVGAVTAVTSGALSLTGTSSATGVGTEPVVTADPVALAPAAASSRQVTLVASVSPVLPDPPPPVDATSLVKAVQVIERQAAEAAERAAAHAQAKATTTPGTAARTQPASSTASCSLNTSILGAVKSWVQEAAVFLGCQFGKPTMHGVASRGGPSDHPNGLAVDFMVDRATGDRLAACALANQKALGIKYVIWRQRINHGSGWELMEDRGSATANHYDHVHISFNSRAGTGTPVTC